MQMKSVTVFISFMILSVAAQASLKDGTYVGKRVHDGGNCRVEVAEEGDYIYLNRTEYRLTLHRVGPYTRCQDADGQKYPYCASGDKTTGSNNSSLYMVISRNGLIDRLYLNDHRDGSKEIICKDLELLR